MNYGETLEYLYAKTPMYQKKGDVAYKEGLDNILRLDGIFGHPHHAYKTIHIAGTNGKGSVSLWPQSCNRPATKPDFTPLRTLKIFPNESA